MISQFSIFVHEKKFSRNRCIWKTICKYEDTNIFMPQIREKNNYLNIVKKLKGFLDWNGYILN